MIPQLPLNRGLWNFALDLFETGFIIIHPRMGFPLVSRAPDSALREPDCSWTAMAAIRARTITFPIQLIITAPTAGMFPFVTAHVEFVSGRPSSKYILSLYLGCDSDP